MTDLSEVFGFIKDFGELSCNIAALRGEGPKR